MGVCWIGRIVRWCKWILSGFFSSLECFLFDSIDSAAVVMIVFAAFRWEESCESGGCGGGGSLGGVSEDLGRPGQDIPWARGMVKTRNGTVSLLECSTAHKGDI